MELADTAHTQDTQEDSVADPGGFVEFRRTPSLS